MNDKFCYIVSYVHNEGYGNSQITRDREVKDMNDIVELQNLLIEDIKEKEGNTIKNLCITNFQLF